MMIRRRVTLTRGLLVLLVLLLGYAAAAEPISALDNFVEGLREGDMDKARSFVMGPFDAIIEMTPVVQTYFTHFSREVRDVGMSGNNRAYIYLDFTVIDSNYAYYSAMGPLELRRYAGREVSDDMVIEALVEVMNSEKAPTVTVTTFLIVEREEGVWKIAEDNELFFKELFSE